MSAASLWVSLSAALISWSRRSSDGNGSRSSGSPADPPTSGVASSVELTTDPPAGGGALPVWWSMSAPAVGWAWSVAVAPDPAASDDASLVPWMMTEPARACASPVLLQYPPAGGGVFPLALSTIDLGTPGAVPRCVRCCGSVGKRLSSGVKQSDWRLFPFGVCRRYPCIAAVCNGEWLRDAIIVVFRLEHRSSVCAEAFFSGGVLSCVSWKRSRRFCDYACR